MVPLPPAVFELTLSNATGAPWTVTRVSIHEALNDSYRIIVEAESESDTHTDVLVGSDAALGFLRGGQQLRAACGVVARSDYLGHIHGNTAVRLEIVPAFELLRQRVHSKIWQDASVQTIVGEVLTGLANYGRNHEFGSVRRGTTSRDYCTQYRESDFAYCVRLLEEEGISYEFLHDHEAKKETLTFRDANEQYEQYKSLDGNSSIPIVTDRPDLADVESIQDFEWSHQLTSTATMRRDYDWKTPRSLLSESAPGSDALGRGRRVFTHGDRRYIHDDLGDQAKDLQHALALSGRVARGRSNCTGMRPGLRFKLTHSDRPELEREYLITAVTHSGGYDPYATGEEQEAPATAYSNEFECVPFDAVVRPLADTPKPRVHGPQTAIVTGPSGEEIHTDKYGRIQVQFYWEEQPTYQARSSCWVRVAQSWAGAGWGTQFIPRIDMEVMIEFLEGNPDRPLCTGCVYNGEYPPPFAVPENKTQSGWRTNTSPGGGGFNELRFEDLKDKEEIYIHGQKDWRVKILNDHREEIGHDQYQEVGNNQENTVRNDQTETIGNDRTESIGNNVNESVGKLRTVRSGDNMTFNSEAETLVQAANKITLRCGAASMTMKSDGNIVLKGSNITLKASGNIVMLGTKIGGN